MASFPFGEIPCMNCHVFLAHKSRHISPQTPSTSPQRWFSKVVFYLPQFSESNSIAIALLYVFLALYVGGAIALDFSNSKWIWKNHNEQVPPYELGDFRYDFTSPFGKRAASAEIVIAGDNKYTLWVNGEYVGQGDNWPEGQEYCVGLEPERNIFAVEIENAPPTSPAALLSAIQITYTDGTTHTIVTDGTWRAHNAVPGFQSPGYNDAQWSHAVVLGDANSSPWHTPTLPSPPSPLTLSGSSWIWTKEVTSPGGNAPIGHRAFRKDIHLPGGRLAKKGTIVIDTDNGYTLYINGKEIGQGNNWEQAQRWAFTFDFPTSDIVIAVDAFNTGGPAGLIATIALNDGICGSTSRYTTDNSWKYSFTVPAHFEQPFYNDYNWPNAIVEGPYGMSPWGNVPIVNA